MTRYAVHDPSQVSYEDPLLGHVGATFDAGEVEPRSEQEEAALKHLVDLGLAEPVKEREDAAEASRPRRPRTTNK